ncbi:uncharacterized protein LOC135114417 [Scylla paramamosain]|uniref:uncharacterized protein LOC135114417 n=1 Tax=Scylla paramamosain TaxID=85552 RepID=UPI003083161B
MVGLRTLCLCPLYLKPVVHNSQRYIDACSQCRGVADPKAWPQELSCATCTIKIKIKTLLQENSKARERFAKLRVRTAHNLLALQPILCLCLQLEEQKSRPSLRDNIFAGLQIKLQKLEDVPAPSHVESDNMSVTSVSQQSWSGTKADKRKKRHQELLEKIDVVRAGQIAEKNRKKREKTVITGDMHPLLNALAFTWGTYGIKK